MELWKYFLCSMLLVVVLSDEAADVPNPIDKLQHSDSTKIFPQDKEKMKELADKFTKATKKKQVAIINEYTDAVVENLNSFLMLQSLDPYPLPDIEEGFNFKLLFITYHGEMSLTDGWLTGLASIKRVGDVTLTYEYPNVKIHSPFGFENLGFDYQYKAKLMDQGPSGGIDGRIDGFKYTFDLNLNMITLQAELTDFRLNTLGAVDVHFTGNTMVDWMINICSRVVISMVKPVIRIVVESFLVGGVETIILMFNNATTCLLSGVCS